MMFHVKWIAFLTLSFVSHLKGASGGDECAAKVASVQATADKLKKYQILRDMQNKNEDAFYSCLMGNLEKLLPIVYTPVLGEVCQKYAMIRGPNRGIILKINEVDFIKQKLQEWKSIHGDVEAIVVTDGGRVLGLGDLGANGMGISVGKMVLYTALGGVNPKRCLPVALDVGTDNEPLRNNGTLYVGMQAKRKKLRDQDYKDFVDKFVNVVLNVFGSHTLIQFEDFKDEEANFFLRKYQKENKPVFNGDSQTTGGAALAGVLAANRLLNRTLLLSKILLAGAGEDALGIANLLALYKKERESMTQQGSRKNIYLMDGNKLITDKDRFTNDRKHFRHRVEKDKNTTDLLEIIKWLKPDILIGVSSTQNLFTPAILQEMAVINKRPVIFALSNPTSKSECTAESAYTNTKGKAVFASGSPFPAVKYGGKTYHPPQCNNAFIFPGVALGATAAQMTAIDDTVFLIAAETLATKCINMEDIYNKGRLFPELQKVRDCSVLIAMDVATYAFQKGLSAMEQAPSDVRALITNHVYRPT